MSGGPGVLTRRTLGGILWMGWGKGATAVSQLLVLAVLARLLAPTDFGIVSAAMIVIGFSGIFSRLGLGPALVQRPELEDRHLRTATTVSLLFGFTVGALVWAGAPVAAAFFRIPEVGPVLRVLAWLFPLQGVSVVAESLILKQLRFRWLAQLDVVSYALGYGAVGIGCAAAGLGVWALVAGQMTQSAVKTVALLARSPLPRTPHLERRALGELMYFGSGFTLAKIANHIALDADNLVVGRWLGPAALGVYGRAYQLMAMPAKLFGNALDDVLFPVTARVQTDVRRLAAAYRRGVAVIALGVLPASVVLAVLAPEFIHVVLGPGWIDVVAPFQLLAVGMVLRTSYKMSDSIARSTGAVYRRAWRQFIYAALVAAGAFVGRRWGVEGVALGVLAALAGNFLLMAHLGLVLTRMSWRGFAAAHAPAARLAAIMGATGWAIAAALRSRASPPALVLGLAACGAAMAAGLVAVRRPRAFLGDDGLWFIDTLQELVARRLLPSRRPMGESHEGESPESRTAGSRSG